MASSSGNRDTTTATASGVRGSTRRALTNPKVSSTGKQARKIHEEADVRAAAHDRKGVQRITADAVAIRKVGAVRSSQAIKLNRKITEGRNEANRADYQTANGKTTEETAHQLLTAFKTGKTVRIFQSKALEKNSSQPRREVSQTVNGSMFRNRQEVEKVLKDAGLEDSVVSKLDDGRFQITHSMKNGKSGSPEGRVEQGKVMALRRALTERGGKGSVKTTHHAGEEVPYSPVYQRKVLRKFAKDNPNSHVSKAYVLHRDFERAAK